MCVCIKYNGLFFKIVLFNTSYISRFSCKFIQEIKMSNLSQEDFDFYLQSKNLLIENETNNSKGNFKFIVISIVLH